VLVVDPRNRAVAAFHAGWRGTVQQIVEQGVVRMRDEFASDPRELLAAVGPAIGACCYEVGEELRDRFADRFAYAAELFSSKPTLHLDLAEANRRQLISAGLAPDSITMTGLCTNCRRDRFFSHRAERGVTGRMMTIAGIRSNLI
jgi:YfiH family protein